MKVQYIMLTKTELLYKPCATVWIFDNVSSTFRQLVFRELTSDIDAEILRHVWRLERVGH